MEAQFSYDGMSLVSHHIYHRLPAFPEVPRALWADWAESDERAMYGVGRPAGWSDWCEGEDG